MLGADHPNTLRSRNNLAAAYQAAGRTAEAIPLYERTLADRERVLGADHPNTLASRNNLAAAYQAAGRTAEAIPLHERTLADRERVLGADHPNTLTSRNNLAVAYQAAGRTAEAIPLLRADARRPRAGAGRRPPEHPDVAEQPRDGLPRLRGGRPRRSRCLSGRSPTASGCWAPTTRTP